MLGFFGLESSKSAQSYRIGYPFIHSCAPHHTNFPHLLLVRAPPADRDPIKVSRTPTENDCFAIVGTLMPLCHVIFDFTLFLSLSTCSGISLRHVNDICMRTQNMHSIRHWGDGNVHVRIQPFFILRHLIFGRYST